MDELYFTPGPPLKFVDPINNNDPLFLSVIVITSIIQFAYICYILRINCRYR